MTEADSTAEHTPAPDRADRGADFAELLDAEGVPPAPAIHSVAIGDEVSGVIVKVEDERSFVFPDFSGNFHFNTVGNILLNPKAGFLFVEFETGDLVYLTGGAEIVWDGGTVEAFRGAQRLIRFSADEVVRVERSLPLRFTFDEYSPLLENTGSWTQAARIVAAEQAWSAALERPDSRGGSGST